MAFPLLITELLVAKQSELRVLPETEAPTVWQLSNAAFNFSSLLSFRFGGFVGEKSTTHHHTNND
jgi:hypothetical protein